MTEGRSKVRKPERGADLRAAELVEPLGGQAVGDGVGTPLVDVGISAAISPATAGRTPR